MNESEMQASERRVEKVVAQLLTRHTTEFCSTHAWSPAINVYLLADRAAVCVELAGLDRDTIDVQAESRLLTIRGQRSAPQPAVNSGESVQLVVMEINYGPFQRVIRLPQDVDVDQVEATLSNGLMWVTLPWRQSSKGRTAR